ncbi:hypothetical protein [uncultured Sphaerochaeta sp.]|uniref:hypothetical protein n=1 Tax=uncultured Sphaerochaeta sp. TaxID=886478 RepID=UPI002A0A3B1F|nr:hypothetical protein [uncultured Sphaerochaeta sp.]
MGTKNTLLDLNDYLFMQIEKLSDDDLSQEELEKEIKRSKAIEQIASRVIGCASVVLDAAKFNSDFETKGEAPRLLTGDKNKGLPK